MPNQTRNQQYAAKVFNHVMTVPPLERDKYTTMAHKLPILIRTAGLAQALAFVNTTKEHAHERLLDHLAETVGAGSRENLLDRIRLDELPKYIRLTQETLAASLWYKRFAQSWPEAPAGNQGVPQ
jgi:CRISPR-associated protein Cmr5